MNLKVLEKKDKEVKFKLTYTNPSFVNTIKRLIDSEVPSMAIEEVDLVKNSSVMYDETLVHRLGLIPLTTDLESYSLPEDCECDGEGCSRCQVKLKLEKEGPGKVYSGDVDSTDSKIKPVYDNIPITLLREGQSIKLVGKACLGRGKDHTKFSPGLLRFKGYPEIDLNTKKIQSPEEISSSCPKDILKVEDGELVKDEEEVSNCNACEACAEYKGVDVNISDSDFIITLESWGEIEPHDMMQKALDIFESKVGEFEKKLNKSVN